MIKPQKQDKEKKLMKTLKFSDVLNEPVDMRKVRLSVVLRDFLMSKF